MDSLESAMTQRVSDSVELPIEDHPNVTTQEKRGKGWYRPKDTELGKRLPGVREMMIHELLENNDVGDHDMQSPFDQWKAKKS